MLKVHFYFWNNFKIKCQIPDQEHERIWASIFVYCAQTLTKIIMNIILNYYISKSILHRWFHFNQDDIFYDQHYMHT